MTDSISPNEPAGWELIWRLDTNKIPPRYRSDAAPNDQVVALADALSAGNLVLDIGCGMGRHLLYLASRGFRVAGMDISPTSIQTSQAVCAEHNILFDGKVSDMTTLAWEDNTFDGAFAIATIHHHRRADIVKALSEVRRVLKPGGLFVADFPSTETAVYQRNRSQVAAGILAEVEPNTFVDQRETIDESDDEYLPHHFCDEADLRDLMREFEIVKLVADLTDIPPEHGTGKHGKWVVWGRKT